MLSYLRGRIVDEIDDANNYMRKAIENRGKPCGHVFAELAEQESKHAGALYYNIFSKLEKPADMPDKDYSVLLKEILDKFSSGMQEFEAQKRIYMMH